MIFVQSGGKEDYYFNFAHNCNVGIKRAMKYNPNWVIVSNDDMYKIDDVDVLVKQLHDISRKNYNFVFIKPFRHHTRSVRIIKINYFYNFFNMITNYNAGRFRLIEHKKFNIKFITMRSKYALIFSPFQKGYHFMEAQYIQIFSHKFVEKASGNIFDENYINSHEDTDLSLRINLFDKNVATIDYNIGNYMGSSLGNNDARYIRDVLDLCYFNFKWENELQKIEFFKRSN
jgi:GT2 family glycosyltransferase